MAGGVIGDGAAEPRADVGHADLVDEVLRQLPRPIRDSGASGQLGEVGPHVRRAGPRRRHDRVVGAEDSTNRRASARASGRWPALKCSCPQQVCSAGKSTSIPARRRTLIVAFPTSGAIVSARHVTRGRPLKRFKPRQAASAVSTARSRRFVVKTILCYGDSNTWGCIPVTEEREWPGGCPRTSAGRGYFAGSSARATWVVEQGLNGRTTVWDDPLEPYRNGAELLPTLLTHQPVDLVILMLGTNDVKRRFDVGAGEIAAGARDAARSHRRQRVRAGARGSACSPRLPAAGWAARPVRRRLRRRRREVARARSSLRSRRGRARRGLPGRRRRGDDERRGRHPSRPRRALVSESPLADPVRALAPGRS